jgi:hypothetical protein
MYARSVIARIAADFVLQAILRLLVRVEAWFAITAAFSSVPQFLR